METVLQISALAVIAAVLCVVVRAQSGALAVLLSLCASVGIAFLAFRFLSPILSVIRQLRELTGLEQAATAPMLKAAGIGLLTQTAAAICEDSGEKALSRAVETGGTVLSLYVSLPLLSAVLELLKETLGG